MTRPRWIFPAVVAVAFALRAAHIACLADPTVNPFFGHPLTDAGVHDAWARGLLDGTWPPAAPFFRAPLYPFFLGGLYKLLGPENRLAVQMVHALVSSLGAGLAALCALRLWGARAAWAAGLLCAALWTNIHYAGELLGVSLAVTLDLWLLWLLLRGEPGKPPRTAALLGIGAVWGLSAITRPTILILAPVVAWYLLRRRGLGPRPGPWLVLAAGLLLPILPVALHNAIRGGEAVVIASQGGINFYIGNNAQSDGQTARAPGLSAHWRGDGAASLQTARRETGQSIGAVRADRHFLAKGLDFWRRDPGRAMALTARKAGLLLAAGERSNNKNLDFWRERSRLLRWPLWPGWALILALGAVGLARRDTARGGRLLLLGSIAAYSLAVIIFFVNARYRLPVAALLAVAAGGGADVLIAGAAGAIRDRKRRRWRGRTAAAVVAASILLAVSFGADRIGSRNPGDEDRFESLKLLGDGYLAAGDQQRAVDAYESAVEADRIRPEPYRIATENDLYPRLAGLLAGWGRRDEARRRLSGWARLRPELAAPRLALGELLLQSGDPAGALGQYAYALAAEPGNSEAALGRAWALYHLGKTEEALESFRALENDPGDVRALFGDGLCRIRLDQPDAAERAFRRVLDLRPRYWQALGNLAGLYERTGRLAEARAAYRRLLKIHPGDERARAWLDQDPG